MGREEKRKKGKNEEGAYKIQATGQDHQSCGGTRLVGKKKIKDAGDSKMTKSRVFNIQLQSVGVAATKAVSLGTLSRVCVHTESL